MNHDDDHRDRSGLPLALFLAACAWLAVIGLGTVLRTIARALGA